MEFFKKHYEKVILLGLFVLFVALMVGVRGIIKSTQEVKPEHLKIKKPVADYNNVDQNADEFKTEERWTNSNLSWEERKAEADLQVSDLVTTYKMTRCPYCSSRGNSVLIPLSVFYAEDKAKRICPECKHPLETPLGIDVIAKEMEFYKKDENARIHEEDAKNIEKIAGEFRTEYAEEVKKLEEFSKSIHEVERQRLERLAELERLKREKEEEARRREEERDKDDDGIDDEDETKWGMDPQDKDDIYYDIDGDGFSNICEIKNGTIPNDPKSHPPLWWRLKIESISQIELPVMFMALVDNDSPDKSTWLMQFNYPDPHRRGRITSQYLMMGGMIVIDKRQYKVVDIEKIITERKQKGGRSGSKDVVDKINESRVTLLEVDPPAGVVADRLIMTIGKKVFSSDYRPVLIDTGNLNAKRRGRVLRVGETIALGLFAQKNGEKLKKLSIRERRNEVRVYKLVSVDARNMTAALKDVTPVRRGEAAPADEVIVITREGKVPNDQLPQMKRKNKDDDWF